MKRGDLLSIIKKSYDKKEIISYEDVEISEAKCCRCGYVNKVENIAKNKDTPLINEITLSSLNADGVLIPEFEGDKYYICDDCWNDLLTFFDEVVDI